MFRKHHLLLLSTLLVMILATACRASMATSDDRLLDVSGTIRATEIRIAGEVGGRILEVYPKVGAEVKQGDVLVVLDPTPLLLESWQKEAAIVSARADLEAMRAEPRPEAVAAARSALLGAEAKRDGALSAWEHATKRLESPQDIDEQLIDARGRVRLAAQGVEFARAQLVRQEILRDQNKWGSDQYRIADLQVQAAKEALALARADEKTAQTLLEQLQAIRDEPLGLIAQARLAEGEYRIAEAGVAAAQAELDSTLAGPSRGELAVAEATLRHAEAEARVLQVRMEQCQVSSPVDGVVLCRSLRRGELAAPAATILTVADIKELTLKAYVPENRIGQVKLGQTAEVTVDSFPGGVFSGRVNRIADEAEFTPRDIATEEGRLNTFYAVEMLLPNPDGLLKPGIPADAKIMVR